MSVDMGVTGSDSPVSSSSEAEEEGSGGSPLLRRPHSPFATIVETPATRSSASAEEVVTRRRSASNSPILEGACVVFYLNIVTND